MMLSFRGEYSQVPPMYSALKVNGKKLYELAREGKEVERKARKVVIRELEILKCSFPVVRFRTVCSKGTYIRTLCADIGERLGCGGTMQSLRRTRVGEFELGNACTLGELQQLKDSHRLSEAVIPVCRDHRKLLENGNAISQEQTVEKELYASGTQVRMYGPEGWFGGIYAYDPGRKWYRPVKMFLEKE